MEDLKLQQEAGQIDSSSAKPKAKAISPDEVDPSSFIAEADTLLLTVPNQLGVDYNAHVIESILTHVAPALGWRLAAA